MSNKEKKFFVEKGSYEKGGKTYAKYVVKGTVRGVELVATLTPPDIGGFQILSIIFMDSDKAELVLKPYEIKDDKTGNVIKGNTYAVMTTDKDGETYECPVRPLNNSDKIILQMLTK